MWENANDKGNKTYTQAVVDNITQYAENYGKASKIELENMPEDASLEDWKQKLEDIAEEFICSPRYFLMCWLAAKCLHQDLFDGGIELGEFPKFEYKPKFAKKVREFAEVNRKHAMDLEKEELDQYVEVLTKIASKNEGVKLQECEDVFRQAFLWYPSRNRYCYSRKRLLISKDETLKIAHMLRMNYEETSYFLVRVVENEALDFTRSADVIHAYCLIRGKSYGIYKQLLKEYEKAAENISKAEVEDKENGFTAGMMPGSQIPGRRDDQEDLYIRIGSWKEAVINEALEENEKKNDREMKEEAPGEKDLIDVKFMEWLISLARYLDIPSKSALSIYRNLTAYAYKYTLDHNIGKQKGSGVGKDRYFLVQSEENSQIKKHTSGIYGELEDSLEEPEQNPKIIAEKFWADFNKICSKDSLYQFRSDMNEADYKILVSNRLNYLFYTMTDKVYEQNHLERIMRYTQVTPNGNLTAVLIADRVAKLLSGVIPVTKADMLFMFWLVCNLYWSDKEKNEICGVNLKEKIDKFLKKGSEVLEEGHLPALYVPHILERTFILSFCIDYVSASEDALSGTVPTLCLGASTPIQVYLALGAFVNSPISK